MKRNLFIIMLLAAGNGYCQTLFVPSGTGGIGASSIAGGVGIGTSSPRGQFDVAGTGDIYLSNNPITGTGQSIYLPGHIFMAPYGGSDWTYLQARRPDNSGSTNLTLRTWNAGAMTQAMTIRSNGDVGIGTTAPQAKMHILDGQVMSSDLNFYNINVRLDGRSIPVINFTRWIGSGAIQHNAFVGQFFNTSAGNEYSFGIGTGYSASGDQSINNKVLTVLLSGNVGIGTTSPNAKLDIGQTSNENPAIKASNFQIVPHLLNGSWNGISRNGDAGIILLNGQSLVIAPHQSAVSGLRMTAEGNIGIGTSDPKG
jgi:hypothetical protein